MLYKPRTESAELLIMTSLNNRMSLLDKDKQHYFSLKKGYEGEVLFDTWTSKLQCDCLILNDLFFKVNNTHFQIDSTIITSEFINIFEVKNFEGDYYYESDRFYTKNKTEVSNPLTQLTRCESLLRQLLQNIGYNMMSVHSSVVFVNPEFTLYQSPPTKPFIFPSQINRYFKNFNSIPSRIEQKHKRLAEKLALQHIKDPPFNQVPSYHYEQLKKGITCEKCGSFKVSIERWSCICQDCGQKEVVADAVIRSVKEFKLLFPNERITTNVIHEWCRVVDSKERIRDILQRNFKIVGVHQWAYYE